MGLNSDLGRASVRFSLGMSSDQAVINSAIEWINMVLAELRVKN
jgi:cysteine desulfurase